MEMMVQARRRIFLRKKEASKLAANQREVVILQRFTDGPIQNTNRRKSIRTVLTVAKWSQWTAFGSCDSDTARLQPDFPVCVVIPEIVE
jgi:hypothetical protein